MTITLTPQLEALIRQKVEAGPYATADEVIEEALQALEERERLQQLRAKLQIGLDQIERGEVIEYTSELHEQIRQSARHRVLAGEKPNPDVCP